MSVMLPERGQGFPSSSPFFALAEITSSYHFLGHYAADHFHFAIVLRHKVVVCRELHGCPTDQGKLSSTRA